jgi:hypothetical protein
MHNEELHKFYSSPNVVWVIKLMRMRWAGHVENMGDIRNIYNILVGKREGKKRTRKT